MTVPEERTRAVLEARAFLQELIDPKRMPGVSDEVRGQARSLLRHYPDDSALRLAHMALPHLFAPVPLQGRHIGATKGGFVVGFTHDIKK